MSADECSKTVRSGAPGDFLVRRSDDGTGYVICVSDRGNPADIAVTQGDDGLRVSGTTFASFRSITAVVAHLRRTAAKVPSGRRVTLGHTAVDPNSWSLTTSFSIADEPEPELQLEQDDATVLERDLGATQGETSGGSEAPAAGLPPGQDSDSESVSATGIGGSSSTRASPVAALSNLSATDEYSDFRQAVLASSFGHNSPISVPSRETQGTAPRGRGTVERGRFALGRQRSGSESSSNISGPSGSQLSAESDNGNGFVLIEVMR